MEKELTCKICNCAKYKVLIRCNITKDLADITASSIKLFQCENCGFVFIDPVIEHLLSKPSNIYTKKYFDANYMKYYGGNEHVAPTQSNESFDYRLTLINKYKTSGKLLDIGCASGLFIAYMKEHGWETNGVEISEYAAKIASAHGLQVFNGTLEKAAYPDASFDVITAGDVLEHIPDLDSFLSEISRILKPDGIVYIAVPNFEGVIYQVMLRIAHFNKVNYFVLPHHLYQFTPSTLTLLLKKHNFFAAQIEFTMSNITKEGLKGKFYSFLNYFSQLLNKKDRMIFIAMKGKQ